MLQKFIKGPSVKTFLEHDPKACGYSVGYDERVLSRNSKF